MGCKVTGICVGLALQSLAIIYLNTEIATNTEIEGLGPCKTCV